MDLAAPMDYRNEVSFDSTTSAARNDISQLPLSANFKEDVYADSLGGDPKERPASET